MKKYFILFVLIVFCVNLNAQNKEKWDLLIQIKNPNKDKIRSLVLMVGGFDSDRLLTFNNNKLVMLSSKAEFEVLKNKDYDVSILMQDTCNMNLLKRAYYGETLKIPESYHTYDRILALIDSLAKKNPALIKKFPIGKTTQDKRTIYAVKISNNVNKFAPVNFCRNCL